MILATLNFVHFFPDFFGVGARRFFDFRRLYRGGGGVCARAPPLPPLPPKSLGIQPTLSRTGPRSWTSPYSSLRLIFQTGDPLIPRFGVGGRVVQGTSSDLSGDRFFLLEYRGNPLFRNITDFQKNRVKLCKRGPPSKVYQPYWRICLKGGKSSLFAEPRVFIFPLPDFLLVLFMYRLFRLHRGTL